MTTPPARTRTRRTAGSKTLGEFIDRHGLRPVSVYLPEKLHRALTETAIEAETTIQAIITMACNTMYGTHHDLPPLVAPTRTKQDPHKSFTWYADIDLHKRIKLLAVDLDGTVQQLVLSAIVEYMKDAPRVKALKIKTGYAAYARAPEVIEKPAVIKAVVSPQATRATRATRRSSAPTG